MENTGMIVEQAANIDELLQALSEIVDDHGLHDVAIWQGTRLLMVLFGDGTILDRRTPL
jgi:hypothetical protein